MTTSMVAVNGANLYYESAGTGTPLVMAHAGIADARMWDDQFVALAEHYQVVRYDERGYGRSQPAAGAFYQHENLRALLQHLGIEQAVLMGCSMGGMTMIDLALEYPELVKALILVASGLSGYEGTDEADVNTTQYANQAEEAFYAGDYARASECEVRIWVIGPQRTPEQVPAAVRDKVQQMNLIALQNEARELGDVLRLDPPASERLGEIRVPTLVIAGDSDQPVMLAIADYLTKHIAGAQKIVMSDAAHLSNMEHPEAFNQHVRAFLDNLPG
jgi:3-oxoadipate enol-lactonase